MSFLPPTTPQDVINFNLSPKCTATNVRYATTDEIAESRLKFTVATLPDWIQTSVFEASVCVDEVVLVAGTFSGGGGMVNVWQASGRAWAIAHAPREYIDAININGLPGVIQRGATPLDHTAIYLQDEGAWWSIECAVRRIEECRRIAEGLRKE